jgi:tetratricopeptide (TPR) repeat protein
MNRLSKALIAALWAITFLSPMLVSQQDEAPNGMGSLAGIVRDPQDQPKQGVNVSLEDKGGERARSMVTDAGGGYRFENVPAGTYVLRAELAGFSKATAWVSLAEGEAKKVDLKLGKASTSGSPAMNAPEFYDQPQFTVAGVSQGSNSGGHGSDAVLRTTESLAKATTSLGVEGKKSLNELSPDTEKSLRAAADRQPDNFQANYQLGRALAEDGRDAEAMPFLQKAAKNQQASVSEQAELHHLLGEIEERSGEPLEAVHDYQRAAELDPSERNLFDWGSELLAHRALEPATEVFTKGAALFPHSSRMLLGLGVASYARGNYEQASRNLIAACDLEPANPTPYLFIGKTLTVQTGLPEGYVATLRRFAELHPDNALANYYYAMALKKARNGASNAASTAQIETLLRKAVQLDPKLAEGYLQLGIVLSEQGDSAKAIDEYQKAIAANPQLEEAHYRLAQAYRRAGEQEKAQEQLKIYEQLSKQATEQAEHERREMQQFVISLREDTSSHSESKP